MMTYRLGSKGIVVRQIQKALKLIPDGIFGKLTEEAVKDFQQRHGLKADGIAGPATLKALIPVRLKKSRRAIDLIIVHCSATPEGRSYTASDIRRWHKQQGWSDIGYHYVVRLDGTIENGRDVDLVGSHCVGYNSRSIGVCYIGGVDADGNKPKDTRTENQKASLLSLLVNLRITYPKAVIKGHRDFSTKACPSFDAATEYRNI